MDSEDAKMQEISKAIATKWAADDVEDLVCKEAASVICDAVEGNFYNVCYEYYELEMAMGAFTANVPAAVKEAAYNAAVSNYSKMAGLTK